MVGLSSCLIQPSTPLTSMLLICEARVTVALLICTTTSFCSALCPRRLASMDGFMQVSLPACLLQPKGDQEEIRKQEERGRCVCPAPSLSQFWPQLCASHPILPRSPFLQGSPGFWGHTVLPAHHAWGVASHSCQPSPSQHPG